jgi:hypothetical protein
MSAPPPSDEATDNARQEAHIISSQSQSLAILEVTALSSLGTGQRKHLNEDAGESAATLVLEGSSSHTDHSISVLNACSRQVMEAARRVQCVAGESHAPAVDDSQSDQAQHSRRRPRNRTGSVSPGGHDIRLPLFTIKECNELVHSQQLNTAFNEDSSAQGSAATATETQPFGYTIGEESDPCANQLRTRTILNEAIRQCLIDTSLPVGELSRVAALPMTDGRLNSTLRAETPTPSLLFGPVRPVRHRSPPRAT